MAIKLRLLTKFPALVQAATGLAVERLGRAFTFSLDLGSLNTIETIADDTKTYLSVVTEGDPDVHERISVQKFLTETSAVNQDRQIISGAGLTGGGDLSADRTLAVGAGTGIAVAADAVSLAAIAAYGVLLNNSGSSAAPTGVEMSTLTTKSSPAAGDYVMISDQAAGGALKKATVSSVGSAGSVSSLNGLTGALSLTVTKQVFTSSGTYTPTTGMKYAVIECVGGGGGGGGAVAIVGQEYGAGGGGSGGYSRVVVSAATVGASQTVTIGAAGTAGTSVANGGAGGDTSVGSLCIGKGGSGGQFGSSTQIPLGGAGGVAGTGDLVAAGAPGQHGAGSGGTTVNIPSGAGGSSFFGGGGNSVYVFGAATAGVTAGNYGSGGGGAMASNTTSNANGGAGKAGVVFVTEYLIN